MNDDPVLYHKPAKKRGVENICILRAVLGMSYVPCRVYVACGDTRFSSTSHMALFVGAGARRVYYHSGLWVGYLSLRI